MRDQLTPGEKITRGMDAARLLKDDTFRSVIAELADEFMDEWKATKSDETAKREALWHHVTALYDLTNALGDRVQAGEVEQKMQEFKDAKEQSTRKDG
jgi:hypothetical protein